MKVIAGSLAFHADTAVITDVTAFEAEGAKSMYFGGIAERVQKAAGNVAIYTIGAGVFDGAEGANGSVAEQEWVAPARPVKVVSSQVIEKSGVNLFKADVVVAAGRGFAEESQLSLANDLCDKLGAGLACSRPLTEGVNWLPTERYVGVSGLMLTPKAYIAVGISGQVQHMVGIMLSLQGKLQADAADALAVAITHAHVRGSAQRLGVDARTAWGRKGRGSR